LRLNDEKKIGCVYSALKFKGSRTEKKFQKQCIGCQSKLRVG